MNNHSAVAYAKRTGAAFWVEIRKYAAEQTRTGNRFSCEPDYVAMVHQNDVAYPLLRQCADMVVCGAVIWQNFEKKSFRVQLPPMTPKKHNRAHDKLLSMIPEGFGYKIHIVKAEAP